MRRVLFTISLVLISSVIFSQTVKINLHPTKTELKKIDESKSGLTINSTIASITVKNTKLKTFDFFKIYYDGFTKNQNIGAPNTPVITNLIEIPLGAEVNINITNSEFETFNMNNYGLTTKLAPSQRSISKSEDENNIALAKNETIYNTNAFYGNELVKVEILGIARDKRLARVTISPFQYNPVTNEIKAFYNITANISFVNSNFEETNALKAKTASPFFYNTSKQTLNSLDNTSKDVITHYPTKMVIVSDIMFQSQLQPYIQWKTRKGFTVIEAYTNNSSVGTTTTSIKNYLQNLYNAGTPSDPAPSFVLLVGDVAQIPTFTGNTDNHKTDLYYCEYTGDYFPEIYYGRWSAQNTTQLQPQIDKSLEYEQYLMPDPSYLGHMLMVAGVDQEGGDPYDHSTVHGNGQLEYGMDNYFNTAHGISIYEYLYPLSDQPASVQNIKDDYNTGVGYANYTAHCSSAGWYNPSFETDAVPNMTNNHKYPLMVGNCCQSATFYDNECFGEAVLRKANAGAVGYIGGSNYSYWDEDYHWGVGAKNIQADPAASYDATKLGAYDKVSHENGEATSDWFLTNAAFMIAGNYAVEQAGDGKKDYYWEIYHLMGDPSIMNYFGVPTALTVNYTDPITVGETSLTVNTEQYAYVAISQNNVLLDAQYTGTNTSVTLTFTAFSAAGTADLVVTKQNKQPYIGTVTIINNTVNNDAAVSSIVEPTSTYSCIGLTVIPKITIRNGGQTALTSCKVNFSFDGGTTVTQDWNGNLATNATEIVQFGSITLSAGAHTFRAFTTLPNGVADEYTANDELEININVTENTVVAQFTAMETESCVAPFVVEFQNTSTNATLYSWDFGDGTTSTDVSPIHTYNSQGLYTVTLIADAGQCGNDTEIKTDYINIDSSVPCEYCIAGATGDYEYINEVICGTINNQSNGLSPNGYADYAYMSTEMTAEQTYSATVTIGNVWNTDNLYAWIDWNKDGDFEDTNENVYTSTNDGQASYTFSIVVPNNVTNGPTRFRIRVTDDGNSGTNTTPCGNSSYGEVEDYTINLTGITNVNNVQKTNNCEIYPNPNSGIFTIKTTNNNNTIEITDILGKVVYLTQTSSNITNVDLNNTQIGIYIVKITNNYGITTEKIVIK